MRIPMRVSVLLFSVISLVLIMGAARPFDRVPADDEIYSQLDVIDGAGLLDDFSLPEGELSRLEFAVLVRQALDAYGQVQLSGATADSAVEAAMTSLLAAFTDELGQLGSPVALPAAASSSVSTEMEQRIAYLEESAEDSDAIENSNYVEQLIGECDECAECEEDSAIELQVNGDFYIQLQGNSTSYTDPALDDSDYSDINLYWGELGVDVTDGTWSGRFSVNFNDEEDNIDLLEAYARYDCACSEGFFQLGRMVMPFGNNDYYFPTYPAVNDMAYAELNAVGGGWDGASWGATAFLFNPRIELVDEEDTLSDYAFTWDLTKRQADECQDGWRLTAGYTSHLAANGLYGDGPFIDRVGAYNVFGRYDWGGNQYHVLADYTTALDEFDPADLDVDGDGVGDQPSALNVEFVYEPLPDTLWGLNYQVTDQFADYAETRYGALYGRRLSEMTMLKLEYTHGEYGEFVTDSQDSDDTLVAEFNLAF